MCTHMYTHTNTERERERKRVKDRERTKNWENCSVQHHPALPLYKIVPNEGGLTQLSNDVSFQVTHTHTHTHKHTHREGENFA